MNTFPLQFGQLSFFNDSGRFALSEPQLVSPHVAYPAANGTFNVTSDSFNATVRWGDAHHLSNVVGVEALLPLFAELMGTNGAVVTTTCTYPLSGQYDHLPRILFYVLLVTAILFRRNNWVVSAALGVTMSYSAASAVHFFVLLGYHGFHVGDIDYFGIFPVLATAVVTLTPVFAWSTTFRTHRAKIVILYWALLVYVALFIMMFLVSTFNHNLKQDSVDIGFLQAVPAVAICNSTSSLCTRDKLNTELTYESFQACNCVDLCGLLSPYAPLRTGQNMVANVGRNRTASIIFTPQGSIKPFFVDISTITQFVLGFALVQGLVALLQGNYSQQQVRNWLYHVLSMKGRNIFNKRESVFLTPEQQHQNVYRESRHWIAKTVAGTYYIISIITLVLYFPVFVLTIAISEVLVSDFPESEHSDSIGAWTPWVSVGLIVLGTLIVNYHSPLTQTLSERFKVIFCSCCGRRRNMTAEQGSRGNRRGGVRSTALDSLRALFKHCGYEIHFFLWRINTRFVEFWHWWAVPDHNYAHEEAAKQHDAAVQQEIDRLKNEVQRMERRLMMPLHAPGAPKCSCDNCVEDEYTPAPDNDGVTTSSRRGFKSSEQGVNYTTIELR